MQVYHLQEKIKGAALRNCAFGARRGEASGYYPPRLAPHWDVAWG